MVLISAKAGRALLNARISAVRCAEGGVIDRVRGRNQEKDEDEAVRCHLLGQLRQHIREQKPISDIERS